jgi:hypothetical protein
MEMTQTQLAAAIAKALANTRTSKAKKATKTKKAAGKKITDEQRAAFMAQNDEACLKAFTKAGYKDVQPRVNVLTYNKFIAQGRMVRKGEKAVKVGQFSLFHVSQTDPVAVVTADSATANTVAA